MAVSPEDHKRLRWQGQTVAAQILLNMMQHGVPIENIESYAAGMLDGIRNTITANHSEQAAFDMMQRAADAVEHPQLNEPRQVSP